MVETIKKDRVVNFIKALYGGLDMSWLAVIFFAFGSSAMTAFFLVVRFFENTSFALIGVQFEAWIFFAIIIMANCKTPLDSALKTFVFFLISQPLIYLFQVPFSIMGWKLFQYYPLWFGNTVLTFPAAYVGWNITKKNWIGMLLLAPVLVYLSVILYQSAMSFAAHPPRMLIAAVFCFAQIVVYAIMFFPKQKKLIAIAIAVATVLFLYCMPQKVSINATALLPDEPAISENAELIAPKNDTIRVELLENNTIRIVADEFGSTDFSIEDGENTYKYTATVYQDDGGHTQIEVRLAR